MITKSLVLVAKKLNHTNKLELMAYINISRRPSRQERSERHDNDVHGEGGFRVFPIYIL
jgi:hypothetical protein